MRELKFRGRGVFVFDATHPDWYYGYLLKKRDGRFTIRTHDDEHEFYVDPATVGQYTGLRDAGEREIYEGDIVEGYDFNDEDGYGVITWDHEESAWCVENKSNYDDFSHMYGESLNVIGNIHDNPDLLSRDV